MKLVLYHFLSRADFSLSPSWTVQPVRRGLVTAPDRPIYLQLPTQKPLAEKVAEALS